MSVCYSPNGSPFTIKLSPKITSNTYPTILTHKLVTIHFPIFLQSLLVWSLRLSWEAWDDNEGDEGEECEVTDREAATEEAELFGLSDQEVVLSLHTWSCRTN